MNKCEKEKMSSLQHTGQTATAAERDSNSHLIIYI